MTNDQIKDFLKKNGALLDDVEIINMPMFQYYYISNTENGLQLLTKNCRVDTISIPNIEYFIFNYLKDQSKKWYIFNDGTTNFEPNMEYIRVKGVELDDYTKLKHRTEKINKIKGIINDKQIRGNRFLHA